MALALHGDTLAAVAAESNLEDELPRTVKAGALTPRDPLTKGPHPFPIGQALRDSRLKTDDELRAFLADRGIGLRPLPSSAKTVSLPLFARLEPKTEFRGGRIADTDLINLPEAAAMASKHVGEGVTVQDFLRAAARGEILLCAIAHRAVTWQPCQPNDGVLHMPKGSLPTLPLTACQGLAISEDVDWRTIDGHEQTAFGMMGRFTRWELATEEPSLHTNLEDVRVTGHCLSALADAFLASESDTPTNESPPQVAEGVEGQTPPPLTTPELADAFDGVGGQTAQQWRNKLGDVNNHKWLLPARHEPATAPKKATWRPLLFADLLLARDVSADSLNRAFVTTPKLKPWLLLWQEKRRERNAFGQ